MRRKDPRKLPELAPRQREVLHAVIREHLASARPVASAELVRRYRMTVSSATVRNELAALEQLGLLTHPHTSSGRVPTDLGYRYFIEALMPQPDIRPEERVTLSHQFRQAQPDMGEWLRLAASTLARLTAEAAIATYDRVLEEHEVTWTREIHYEGIDQILTQPEFQMGERVRGVLSLLQDRQLLSQVLPGSLSSSMVPWCWVTKVWAIVSPTPWPPSRPLTSGKNILSFKSSGTPGPSSTICTSKARRCIFFASVARRATRVRKMIVPFPCTACAASWCRCWRSGSCPDATSPPPSARGCRKRTGRRTARACHPAGLPEALVQSGVMAVSWPDEPGGHREEGESTREECPSAAAHADRV